MEKGLMSTFEEGKKTFFAPESPEALRRVLDQQKESIRTRESELSRLLPNLAHLFESAGERPVVRFFPGKEGITATREEALTTKDKKVYTIFSYEHLRKIYSEQELDEFSDKRKALNIFSKGIHLHKPYFAKAGLDKLTERGFLAPELLPLTIDISIFDNKTSIRSLEGNLFGVIIESKEIAENMRLIFEFLWKQAEKASEKL
jgi:sugar-specific transcriptional regulator TrmB